MWAVRGGSIALGRPVVMGIVNATPDSFSDGGTFADPVELLDRAQRLIDEGADLVDVGGESTRPGAAPVDSDEEWERIAGLVEPLARDGIAVSIDTSKHEVARRGLDAGAAVVNDVTALGRDPEIADLCASAGAGLVLMHMRGTPGTMQKDTEYVDLVEEVRGRLLERAELARAAGCRAEQIVIDPGLGFGKSVDGNLHLIARIRRFVDTGYPVLVGPSRKSFIGRVLDLPVDQRVEGTIAACLCAYERGARLFRVHDVRPVRRALELARAVAESG